MLSVIHTYVNAMKKMSYTSQISYLTALCCFILRNMEFELKKKYEINH